MADESNGHWLDGNTYTNMKPMSIAFSAMKISAMLKFKSLPIKSTETGEEKNFIGRSFLLYHSPKLQEPGLIIDNWTNFLQSEQVCQMNYNLFFNKRSSNMCHCTFSNELYDIVSKIFTIASIDQNNFSGCIL